MKKCWKIAIALAAAGALGVFPAVSAGHGGPGETHMASELVVVNAKKAKSTSVLIPHVAEGCHVWAVGKTKAANMKLLLKSGAKLTFTNKDINGHQLVQKSGPKLTTARLGMNGTVSYTLTKKGTYKFVSKTFDFPNMPEMESMTPDNILLLTLVVT